MHMRLAFLFVGLFVPFAAGCFWSSSVEAKRHAAQAEVKSAVAERAAALEAENRERIVKEQFALATQKKPACCCDEVSREQLLVSAQAPAVQGAKTDSPLFGGTPARNMVNLIDKNIPTDWSPESKKNIKWLAELGSKAYGGPVIAGGRVFIGTNNTQPRDPKVKGFKSILMCFDEATGKFLWQSAHDAPTEAIFMDVREIGLLSTPVYDNNKLYYVLSQSEVVCTDASTGKTLWTFDMRKELKVVPYHCSNSSPLVVGDNVYLITGNGVDGEAETRRLHSPEAPSFLVLNKNTGKVVWKSNLPGDNVIEGQWSNPAYAVIHGKPQVIFPGGDATIYSFEPDTGKLIWKFHCHPKKAKKERGIENYIVSTPVIHDNKVYIGLGLYPEHPQNTPSSYFLCIDATKSGDVSPGESYDPKAADNKNSALVWAYGGLIVPRPAKGKGVVFGRTISTAAVVDGLVYIPEENGYLHCLDAKTGEKYWVHDFKCGIWGSPYFVDGKVYIGTEEGEIVIFQAGRGLKVLNKVDMGEGLHSTPVVANGVLYVMTKLKLYAIAEKK